mmetsp:Transcript_31795/g.70053  ORF Transcript_31795/g.70053 Transcript_31795/m.70053 type:complete len:360 (-) Transcript_31795:201-1280(-)
MVCCRSLLKRANSQKMSALLMRSTRTCSSCTAPVRRCTLSTRSSGRWEKKLREPLRFHSSTVLAWCWSSAALACSRALSRSRRSRSLLCRNSLNRITCMVWNCTLLSSTCVTTLGASSTLCAQWLCPALIASIVRFFAAPYGSRYSFRLTSAMSDSSDVQAVTMPDRLLMEAAKAAAWLLARRHSRSSCLSIACSSSSCRLKSVMSRSQSTAGATSSTASASRFLDSARLPSCWPWRKSSLSTSLCHMQRPTFRQFSLPPPEATSKGASVMALKSLSTCTVKKLCSAMSLRRNGIDSSTCMKRCSCSMRPLTKSPVTSVLESDDGNSGTAGTEGINRPSYVAVRTLHSHAKSLNLRRTT